MAGFLSYGMAKGLSVEDKWEQRTDSLYRQQAYAENIRQIKAEKVKQHTELTKEHAAASPFYQAKLEEHYNGLNKKMGAFIMDNPDFDTDPVKYKEYVSIADQYLNNDFVREDMTSRAEIEKFRAAASKKGELSLMDIQKNEDAIKAFNDKGTPFRYTADNSPKFQDLASDDLKTLNQALKRKSEEKGFKTITTLDLEPGALRQVVEARYSDPEWKDVIDSKWEVAGKSYDSPEDYYENYLDNLVGRQRAEEYNTAYRAAASDKGEIPIEPHFSRFLTTLGRNKVYPGDQNSIHLTGYQLGSQITPDQAMRKDMRVTIFNEEDGSKELQAFDIGRSMRITDVVETYEDPNGMIRQRVRVEIGIPSKSTSGKEHIYINKKTNEEEIVDFQGDEDARLEWEEENKNRLKTRGIFNRIDVNERFYNINAEIEKLKKYGFSEGKESSGGLNVNVVLGGDKDKTLIPYSGIIDIPVKLTEANLYNYEASKGTKEQAGKIDFNIGRIILDKVKQGDQGMAIKTLNDNLPTDSKFMNIEEIDGDMAPFNFYAMDNVGTSDEKIIHYHAVGGMEGGRKEYKKGSSDYNILINYFKAK